MSTGYVLVADLNSFSIVSTIPLPAGTVVGGIAITPDGSLAYVVTQPYSGSGPSVVYVIDVATRTINLTIPVNSDSNLAQIAMTPDGTEAYLVDSIDGGNFSIPVLDLQSNTVEPSVSIIYGTGKNLISRLPSELYSAAPRWNTAVPCTGLGRSRPDCEHHHQNGYEHHTTSPRGRAGVRGTTHLHRRTEFTWRSRAG